MEAPCVPIELTLSFGILGALSLVSQVAIEFVLLYSNHCLGCVKSLNACMVYEDTRLHLFPCSGD
jgi:hypothetical protein